jgi:O-antigen/teichoic acid export membrane protein
MWRSPTLRTFITNSGILILGFVTSVMLSRWLGPTGRGEVAASMLWPILLVYLSSLGLMPSVLYFSAQANSQTGQIFSTAIVLAAIQSSVALMAGYLAMPWLLASQSSAVISAARVYLFVIPISLLTQYGISILQGRVKITTFNLVRTIIPIGYICGAILLHGFGALTLRHIVILHLVLNLLALIVMLVGLRGAGIRVMARPTKACGRQMLKFGVRVYVGDLSQGMNLRLDQILMAAFLPAFQLGIYVAAVSAAGISQVLSTSIRMVATPAIARESSDVHRAAKLKLVFRRYLVLGLTTTAFMSLTIPFAIPLVFGPHFKQAIWVAEILLIGAVMAGAKDVLAGGTQAMGTPWLSSRAELGALFVTVGLLLLLLPTLGILGAAITSVAAYATQLVIIVSGLHRVHSIAPTSLFRVEIADIKSIIHDFSPRGSNFILTPIGVRVDPGDV